MKSLILLVAVLAVPFQSMASKEVGNGGFGVVIKDKVYLLDLYESGVEKDPYFNDQVAPHPAYLERLRGMDLLSGDEKKLMAQKLTEVRMFSPKLSNYLILGVDLYLWRLLDRPLVEIPEISPIDLSGIQTVQLANRRGVNIRIDKNYWAKMDSKNRVALVLHELLYAFQAPVKTEEGCLEQQSPYVRELIGYIFSPQFSSRGASGFSQISHYEFSPVTLVKNQMFETDFLSRDNGGIIASVSDGAHHDFWKFCENVATEVNSKPQVSGTVSYRIFLYEVQLNDFKSCSGPQKRLVVMQYPEQRINAGDFSFTKKNINTCNEWLNNKSQEIFSPFINLSIVN